MRQPFLHLTKLFLLVIFIASFSFSCSEQNNEKNSLVEKEEVPVSIPEIIEPDLLPEFKGRWVLTDYFKDIERNKAFFVEESYPSYWFAEIEISDSFLIGKGWLETGRIDFKRISSTNLKTTYPSQYWNVSFDTISNTIWAELIEDDKTLWKYNFSKLSLNPSFDITDLAMMLRINCLEGRYLDLEKNEEIEITSKLIDYIPFNVITDYQDLCGDLSLLELTLDKTTTCSWEWNNDILEIYQVEDFLNELGCFTYRKVNRLKELKLISLRKNL